MWNLIENDLRILAGLLLQNQSSFLVRRCAQRFVVGEMTVWEALEHIRENPAVAEPSESDRGITDKLGRIHRSTRS